MQATIQSPDDHLNRFGITERDVQRLIESLNHDDLHSRRAVRATIRELGTAATPALAHALTSPDLAVRQGAAELLRHASNSRDVIQSLIDALSDPDWLVRMRAADALARVGPDARCAERALQRATNDAVVPVRTAAFVALRWIGC